MKTLILAGLAAATLLSAGSTAFAQVAERHANQESRIGQGMRSGELTPGEAGRLQNRENSIHRQAARERYHNGGYLRPGQRARLNARENRTSAAIYRDKHNGRVN